MYRNVKSASEDIFQISFLKNKYYFDELYDFLFVKPIYWFSENVVYKFMDMTVINGILHLFGPSTGGIGSTIRNYFDLPIINRLIGDGSADVTYWFGGKLTRIQSGRIQQYLVLSLTALFVIGGLIYFFLLA